MVNLIGRLEWLAPLPQETEPSYTFRVIYPQMRKLLSRTNPNLVLRADGHLRPQPVVLSNNSFYPDLAINDGLVRLAAVEVKFFTSANDRASLMTGLGQCLIYRAFGYRESVLLLVSKEMGQGLSLPEVSTLQASFPDGLAVGQLSGLG